MSEYRPPERLTLALSLLLGVAALWILHAIGGDLGWEPSRPLEALTYLLHRTAFLLAAWVTLSGVIVTWSMMGTVGSGLARSVARLAVPWLRRIAISSVAGTIAVSGTMGSSLPTLAVDEPTSVSNTIDLPEPVRLFLDDDVSRDEKTRRQPPSRETSPKEPPRRDPGPRTVEDDRSQATSVELVAGDNLWTIAAQRLAEVTGSSVTNTEIAVYWREVIKANRGFLISGDPDLVYPGEVIRLPPLTGG